MVNARTPDARIADARIADARIADARIADVGEFREIKPLAPILRIALFLSQFPAIPPRLQQAHAFRFLPGSGRFCGGYPQQ
jgi:hypothetical protein